MYFLDNNLTFVFCFYYKLFLFFILGDREEHEGGERAHPGQQESGAGRLAIQVRELQALAVLRIRIHNIFHGTGSTVDPDQNLAHYHPSPPPSHFIFHPSSRTPT